MHSNGIVSLWTPVYTPGDVQTSWVYSSNPVLHLYISCYLTVNKPVLSYTLLCLLPQASLLLKFSNLVARKGSYQKAKYEAKHIQCLENTEADRNICKAFEKVVFLALDYNITFTTVHVENSKHKVAVSLECNSITLLAECICT
jgi:hypothetical protein